ncbi:exonuclease SbcCD subunit D [Alteribacillus iranensis]|uniref:Nuclease SbcCD subunit D n=1 Tax=Alteribacillus iranensis TaxID=930128 RepID=A0A1I1ZZ12_9BACI|nr:exonuclease SbcCD subunit D [Alteribacillus iranensis]SFE35943.1 Exodeoxyribonuclease I subunit D [Alteribacillus iranensis]
MRVLHTADWHLGRTLEGRSRIPEYIAFFQELEQIIKSEAIDVLLMAGDVFDSVNPPAAAEEMFYETIARLNRVYNVSVVIIAGNHDHPARISAVRSIAKNQGIYILGYPTMTPVRIPVGEEVLEIGALPYPSESRMGDLFSKEPEEEGLREAYNEKIRYMFHELTRSFQKNHVGMAMSHLFVAGGAASDSERPIEVGGAYTVTVDALPDNVQYTALGHLHRPQTLKGSKGIARYSGSPLAFSFSESGYAKSVTVVDVKPGSTPHIEEIPLSSGKPLVRWKAVHGLEEVYQWLAEEKDKQAWVDVEIHLHDTPSLEQIHHIRKAHEGIIHIHPVFLGMEQSSSTREREELSMEDLFQRFYERQTGGAQPTDELTRLFLELIEEEESEED